MKKLTALAALMLSFSVVLTGCGNDVGDPNANANPAPPETSQGRRPGTPGGPPVTAPVDTHDPSGGGRPGM